MPQPAMSKPRELWTGAQLFSALLPPSMTMVRCAGALGVHLPAPGDLLIYRGELLFGTLSKSTLGSSANGIVDVMYRDFGPQPTVRFMSDAQRVVNQWLLGRGFSVGISDCVLGEAPVTHPAGWPAMVLREYGGLTLHQQTEECLGEWQARVLGPRAPCTHQPLRWWPNALFAVQARNVGRTPRAAYVAMLRSLVACATCSAPVAGHYLERSWVYIVNATPGCSDAT